MTANTANDQRRGSTAAVWLVVAFLALPVLYVLSTGPYRWLIVHGCLRGYEEKAVAFYWPIGVVANNCPRLGTLWIGIWTFGDGHLSQHIHRRHRI
jgi:hypothetical protein